MGAARIGGARSRDLPAKATARPAFERGDRPACSGPLAENRAPAGLYTPPAYGGKDRRTKKPSPSKSLGRVQLCGRELAWARTRRSQPY